jgi:hypothetical protein
LANLEQAFIAITHLVNDFKANEKHFLSQSYSEADVRNDFINKFFIALGWDVRHEEQKNPYEQEVRVEKPLQIAKAQKRADYSFSLAPSYRTVKFFVESKKPSHDLANKDYYFQTARYGWNAHTPIAVLTDFEELHIVDCRFKPNIDAALTYKIMQFHYSDYADKDKFAEIYWLFSREAVAGGSIEKYNESLAKPKGKKAKLTKAVLQSIDEAFLEELDEIRTKLAKSFKKNNEHLSSEELTEATQRTIDRLVFIKFLEDKLIEPSHYISEFGGRKSAWEDFLIDSRKLDAKYNGVVFKKSLIDSRNVIEPDQKAFAEICDELSHENTPYNFDVIPIHILGSIYERFLGKVVHATDKRVTIEEKPEVRKAGGVYYTPQYIVDYIVKNTVGKLIGDKTPKQIAKMRFADIACGSGSFLITVFETLLDYHKNYYQQNPEQAKKDGCILYEGAYRLSLKQKQEILTNNIYGVDIDQQAVEVTQLSLYLKLLEDETTATANDTWVLFKEQLLPDLNKNIVCGNSLIGTDILTNQTSLPLGGTEGGVNELKLKPMDFEKVFTEVMTAGGFDAIVGNPPYFRIEAETPESSYLRKKYSTPEFKLDIYTLFIERCINLRFKKLGYIVPNTLLSNLTDRKLRKLILDKTHIAEISNYRFRVFDQAVVHSMIIILDNDLKNDMTIIKQVSKDEIEQFKVNQKEFSKIENNSFEIRFFGKFSSLLSKIKSNGIQLNQIANIRQAIKTGDDSKYISETKRKKNFKPVIGGSEMERYLIKYSGRFVDYGSYLACPRDPHIFEVNEKILIRETGKRISATYDNEQFYLLSSVYSLFLMEGINYEIKFILGIINSTVSQFYMQQLCFDNSTGAFIKARIFHYEQLPIPKIDLGNVNEISSYKKVISLVDQILTTKKQLQQAKTEGDKNYLQRKCEQLDKEIDQLVYQLYGLTEEEIRIVEGK